MREGIECYQWCWRNLRACERIRIIRDYQRFDTGMDWLLVCAGKVRIRVS